MARKSKTILVTGAASGIGLAITNFLASKGDKVIAADINKEALSKLQDKEGITPLFLDVTDTQSIEKALKELETVTDTLDGLVNNAGIFIGGPLVEIKEEDLERIFAINVFGVFKVTKACFPLLYKAKGRIVNIGSETGRFSFPLNGPYSMTKYALESFSDSLRRELMFFDMKVILLQVGAINTPLLYDTYCSYAEDIDHSKTMYKKQLEAVIKTCQKEMKKGAHPEAVAKVVYKTLHKRFPRIRYRVRNNKLRRMLEFFPTFVVDFAMKRVLK